MNYYNEIKKELINNEVYKKVKDYSKNKSDLSTYYNVGKLLVEAQGGEKRAKYGDNLIKKYFNKLTLEIGSGYSTRSLKRMRKFYLYVEKGTALLTQITWSHYVELLVLDDINEINYYIDICVTRNLSYRKLHDKIKSKEYQRLPKETKEKLINKEEAKINDFIKNPIVIRNKYGYDDISEKMLKDLILEDSSRVKSNGIEKRTYWTNRSLHELYR